MSLPPLIRKQGYYYCERCILVGIVTAPVPIYYRKRQNGFAKHINWVPPCDKHSLGHRQIVESPDI